MAKNDNLDFWILLLGGVAIFISAADIVQHWAYLFAGARICDVLFLASGLALLAAWVWRRMSRPHSNRALCLAATSAGVFALTLGAGVLIGAIPCSGAG